WAGLPVEYPSFFNVPGALRDLNGLFLFLSSVARVARVKTRFDFDVIDAHFTFPDGFAAILLGQLFDCPVTITLHGTLVMLSAFPVRARLGSFALKRAAGIMSVSAELANKAIELGAPPDRVTVIENGVDTERFAVRDRAAARRALGLAEGGRLIVSVGHLSRR